ncbi:succinate dehydrogenase assembly factor 2 [Amaricoccus sp.]|uniref:FAD assembly factor SdhE n=1 Tax=Amaricoccus sp. TaxID=1872485 RepID=UPI001B657F55|nr:succinate dehydrogenase assembly factor 2 [Amaricoccus sp.]MBP7240405.1 succinate dehydrogenase assembly factor 2 [Amaricoccus sp.]
MTDADPRLKRLRLRAWRRGMRETDLLLGPFADAELGRLSPSELDAFESLLHENDQDLYLWISRNSGQPGHFDAIVGRIAAFHGMA